MNTLQENEKVIERGLKTFIEVGNALIEIRDHQLYKELDFHDFETYCRERWNLSLSYANNLIIGAETVNVLQDHPDGIPSNDEGNPNLTLPTAMSQARELAPLRDRPGVMRQVWDQAVKRSPQKPPTAALIKETREDYLARVTRYVNGYLQNMEYVIDALTTLNNHEIEDKLIPLIRDAHFKYLEISSKIIGPNEASSLRRIK